MNQCKLLPCGKIIFYNLRERTKEKSEFYTDSIKSSTDSVPGSGSLPFPDPSSSYMGLSNVVISDNLPNFSWLHPVEPVPRARRGTKGISTHGRNLIRAGCHWLESQFGKRNLSFLTATLPDEAMKLCTPETWAEVTNRFLKSLRYHLKKAGLCPEIVGCTEIQESRLLSTDGIPPLHLHLLFQGKQNYHQWGIDKAEYQRLWQQACTSIWPVECRFESSCRVESIYKSGVSYMSKYLSKGGSVLSKCKPELLPSAWFTVSRFLKVTLKGMISRCDNYLARTLYEQLRESNILTWSHEIYSCDHGNSSRYLIAWVGSIGNREKYWALKNEIDFCISVNTETQNKSYLFNL